MIDFIDLHIEHNLRPTFIFGLLFDEKYKFKVIKWSHYYISSTPSTPHPWKSNFVAHK